LLRRPPLVRRRVCGQRLGGDRLRGVALRELRPGHPPGELHRIAPEDEKAPRAAQAEFGAWFVVIGGRHGTRGADHRCERPDGAVFGESEPSLFVIFGRHADEEPRLRPGESAGEERGTEPGQRLEARMDGREALHVA